MSAGLFINSICRKFGTPDCVRNFTKTFLLSEHFKFNDYKTQMIQLSEIPIPFVYKINEKFKHAKIRWNSIQQFKRDEVTEKRNLTFYTISVNSIILISGGIYAMWPVS